MTDNAIHLSIDTTKLDEILKQHKAMMNEVSDMADTIKHVFLDWDLARKNWNARLDILESKMKLLTKELTLVRKGLEK